MFRLLELIRKKGDLFLFLLLEVVALLLLFRGSSYHSSVLLSSTNAVTGKVNEVVTIANSYMDLREANIELMNRNAELERQVLLQAHRIEQLSIDSLRYNRLFADSVQRPFPYSYHTAKVVGSTLYGRSSYLTIDKGADDGVFPDMGVTSAVGIVGVVATVSQHYAKVLPVIHPDFAISCKAGNGEYVGVLKWDEGDTEHAQLTNLPKHARFEQGDSVFTSNYSAIFPEGVFVGTLVSTGTSADDNFYAFRVKLATRFNTLKHVYVVTNYDRDELLQLSTTTPTAP